MKRQWYVGHKGASHIAFATAATLSHACTRRMAPVATEIDARPLAWQTISLDRATDYPAAPPTLGWTAPIALAIAGALLYLTTVLLPSLP